MIQKINHRTIGLYANGVLTTHQAIEKLNLALASLTIGKNFGEDMDSYLQREPQAMERFKNIVAAKNFFMDSPTIEKAKEIDGFKMNF